MPNDHKHHLRQNLSMAWPLALNALLIQSMLIMDTLLVAPLGEKPVAAMGIATTILAFFLGIQISVGNGSQLVIGRVAGAADTPKLQRTLSGSILISLGAGLCFLVVLQAFGDDLIGILTTDQELRVQAGEYLGISQYLLLFNAVTQSITAFFNGQGNTRTPFLVHLIEVPFNCALSYLLIFGAQSLSLEGQGVSGAAMGSLSAVILRFGCLLYCAAKHTVMSEYRLSRQIRAGELRENFGEILPVATNFVVLSTGHTVYQLLFSQLDVFSYVAVTLIFPWLRIATQFIVAWAQANSISITQAIGQNRRAQLKPIVTGCIRLGMCMAAGVSLALYGLSLSIEHIYPNVEQQTLLAMGSIAPLYVLLPLVRSYNTIAGNSLRAMGRSVQVLRVHFLTQWLVVLPLCALFILYFQLPLFWAFALLPVEEMLKAIPFYRMLKQAV